MGDLPARCLRKADAVGARATGYGEMTEGSIQRMLEKLQILESSDPEASGTQTTLVFSIRTSFWFCGM